MNLLRFITAGSVDDGKSTLIGRLFYDTDSIKLDLLDTLRQQSKNKQAAEIDLAYFTDGLRAEREQGITIDVAYKYFHTPKRKFIIADAPGHIQYTRNMVTGASNSSLIIILIDARHGVLEQTRRHSIIASLLKIPHVTVAINKMDMVNYEQTVFDKIVNDYQAMANELQLKDVKFFPISALQGDNIVSPSKYMPWYNGATLLHHLETVDVVNDLNFTHSRFSIQCVIRPQQTGYHDFRGYAGKIASGTFEKGQTIVTLPGGIKSTIESIEMNGKQIIKAFASQSIVIRLKDNIDLSRGDMIVGEENQPKVNQEFQTTLCWMDSGNMAIGKKYLLQVGSRTVRAIVKDIQYQLDVNTLSKNVNVREVSLNDIVKVTLKTSVPIVYDSYAELRATGAAILIDETSNNTVAGCMLE